MRERLLPVRALVSSYDVRGCCLVVFLGLGTSSAGCLAPVTSAAKPTAVEHQLLGAYQELDADLVRASSVRGPELQSGRSFSLLKSEALEQRGIQRFNEDDLRELKQQGCVAEGIGAKVVAHPCESAKNGELSRRRERILREENRAREVILEWAAYERVRSEGRTVPSRKELEEIRIAYERLIRESAAEGDLIEVQPGEFRPYAP